MSQLKSTIIRNQIHDMCEFCISLVKEKSLRYDVGLDRETALKELTSIIEEVDKGGEFTVAFVGEYSSGKTTLINLLTSTHRQTGTDVTTDEPYKMRWNNVWVIDTPGLGSGRLEHDKKTEEWLAAADLLVYVVTPDLFGSGSGARFMQMLDKYKRAHEMMIVVNMIDKEGNDISVYREELQVALGHRPLDNYYPTFMSARYKEQSLDESQPAERRVRLSQRSRFDTFLENLNAFVLDRRERASLTTPLTRLQVLMQKVRFNTEYDKEEALLNLRMSAFEKALREVKHAYADLKEEMGDVASATSGTIFDALGNPPSDFEAFCNGQLESFNKRRDDCITRLADSMDSTLELLQSENQEIDVSPLAQEVKIHIEGSDDLKDLFESFVPPTAAAGHKDTMAELKASIQELSRVSGKDIPKEWSGVLGSSTIFEAASKLVGKVDRNVVLKVGHILGHKFPPWGAVKLAAKFAKAVPLLNVAGAAWEIAAHQHEKQKKEEAARELLEFKTKVKAMLLESVDKVTHGVYEQLVSNIEKVILAGLELTKEKRSKLATYAKEYNESYKELEAKRTQCMLLYDDIYGTETP